MFEYSKVEDYFYYDDVHVLSMNQIDITNKEKIKKYIENASSCLLSQEIRVMIGMTLIQ